jgi:Mg2+ and Co2+ transporter CorA
VHFPGFETASAWWAIFAVMVAVAVSLVAFFKYKRWL